MTIQQALLMIGTPTLTYATWNAADKDAGIGLSGGNLIATGTVNDLAVTSVRATQGKTSGKWYWEISASVLSSARVQLGLANSTQSLTASLNPTVGGVASGNSVRVRDLSFTSTVYSLLMDLDSKIANIWIAGVDQVLNYDISAIAGTIYPIIAVEGTSAPHAGNTATTTTNFGASAFTYTRPAGYSPLIA